MIRPDTDVRARGPTHARAPRAARRARLARLLLSFARKAVPMLLLSASPACVIPVVPEFKDPPESKNLAPRILNPNPPFGSILPGPAPSLRVTVTDPNPKDSLVVRWLYDYPGSNTRKLPDHHIEAHVDGTPLLAPATLTVMCSDQILETSIALHTITVVVADREFVDPPPMNDLTSVTEGGEIDWTSWTFPWQCAPL